MSMESTVFALASKLLHIEQLIQEFREECRDAGSTDPGDAWELLNRIEEVTRSGNPVDGD